MRCPHCDTETPVRGKKCPNCGKPLKVKAGTVLTRPLPLPEIVAKMAKRKSLQVAIVIAINILIITTIVYLYGAQAREGSGPLFQMIGFGAFILSAGLFIFDLIYLYRYDKRRRGVLKCPNCGERINTSFLFPKKQVKCKCGARIKLSAGFLRPTISDWEPPDDNH